MSPDESRKLRSVREILIAIDETMEELDGAMEELEGAVERTESSYDDRVYALEMDMESIAEQSAKYAGVEDWVRAVVREADGMVLGHASPEAILEWLMGTLRAERGLVVPYNALSV